MTLLLNRNEKAKSLLRYGLCFFVILVFTYVISTYVFQLTMIQGNSMLPTYYNGQIVIINKFDRDYKVGDVVVFRCDDLDSILIKRVDKISSEGFFVLGDNYAESVDSRDERVGLVQKEKIIGKVISIYKRK